MSKKISRHQLREKAVQTLYQLTNPLVETTWEEAMAFALEAGNDPEEGFKKINDAYLKELVIGVCEHQEALDECIAQHLTNEWTLERIARIDRVILRLALYELNYIDDERVPGKVAVNEAIELAKQFSDDKSSKFVAGILMQVASKEV